MAINRNYSYTVDKLHSIENRTNNRIFVLKIKDNTKPKSSIGLFDPRIFTGENRLHAIQDAGLWYVKYDKGGPPPELRQKWTNFNQLIKFVTTYFERRNIELIEIQDIRDGTN